MADRAAPTRAARPESYRRPDALFFGSRQKVG